MTTEQTQKLAEMANAVIEGADTDELLMLAEDAAEPGDQVGTVVHVPDADNPIGQTIADIESAGWKRVYHTQSRELSIINGNMLQTQLGKTIDITDPDGTVRRVRAFTTLKPENWNPPAPPPDHGSVKCILHLEHPDRPEHEAMGFQTCSKSNLRTEYDALRHAQNRHPQEWAVMERQRVHGVEEEERELRRLNLENLRLQQKLAEATTQTAQATAERVTGTKVMDCPMAAQGCQFKSTARTAAGRRSAIYKHKKREHPELIETN